MVAKLKEYKAELEKEICNYQELIEKASAKMDLLDEMIREEEKKEPAPVTEAVAEVEKVAVEAVADEAIAAEEVKAEEVQPDEDKEEEKPVVLRYGVGRPLL